MYYVHPDHLGSLTVVTDASGNIVQKCTFDAWGRRSFVTKDRSLIFDRGYTGHEHLDEFSLINMNGRMYDPVVGRFLSPDPYVADGAFSQDYNRYSYARNNPLIYTDPDGEIVWFVPVIVGAVIGATSGAVMAKQADAQGFWQWAGYVGGGALIGGLSGGAAAGVSALGGGVALAGAAAGGIGGAGFSGMATGWDKNAMLTGFANGAIAGFVGGGIGSAIGGGLGALAGGAASNLTGQLLYNDGNFSKVNWASVAVSAAVSFGMYHGMQYMQYKISETKLNGLGIKSYEQFSKINTAHQRSRFWRREFGVYLNEDGSAKITPWKDTHKFSVDFRSSEGNVYKTMHAHWARGGVDLGGGYETVGGYHSPDDMAVFRGTSFVVGRTTSSYMISNSMTGW